VNGRLVRASGAVSLCAILLLISFPIDSSFAQDGRGLHFELGKEYTAYSRPAKPGTVSAKSRESGITWRSALLYLPNRVLDLVDVFKCDVGVGVGYGAVVRPTRYLQGSYRELDPGMVRLGLLGRRLPVMAEEGREVGFGRDLRTKRKVSDGEFGLGVDLGIVGFYFGLSLDSAADFVLGIVGIDFEKDDLK
jgi:hypothetical protein